MNAVLRKTLSILLVLVTFSCEKDEDSTTGTVDLALSLFSTAALQGKVTVDKASMQIDKIDLASTNRDLQQISFSTDLSAGEAVNLLGANDPAANPSVQATKGVYEPMRAVIQLSQVPYELVMVTDPVTQLSTPDLSQFLQNAKPAILFQATFYNRGESIPVYLALTDLNRLEVEGRQAETPRIRIGKANRAEISFDPANWLQEITTQKLESAETLLYKGEKVIFIHPQFNASLYRSIATRVEQPGTGIRMNVIEIRED